MTEIVAAHLERVAKAESLIGLVLLKLGFTTDHLTDGQLDRARDILAAALAACAREGEKPLLERIEQLEAILNTPELDDFAKGVSLEAKHQRARWGDSHDLDKEPEEWFWVVGYLAGKGLQAQRAGNWDKFKHHLITGAAILANWHARALERAAGEKA